MNTDTNKSAREAAILDYFNVYTGCGKNQNQDHSASAIQIILRRAQENNLDPEKMVEAFEMGMGALSALQQYMEGFK